MVGELTNKLRDAAKEWIERYDKKHGGGGQAELSRRIGRTPAAVSRFLSGKGIHPETARKVAEVIDFKDGSPMKKRDVLIDLSEQLRILSEILLNESWSREERGQEFSRVITAFYDGMDRIAHRIESGNDKPGQ